MYYVYIHTRKSDNTPFYIGTAKEKEKKGTGHRTVHERAFAYSRRPEYWKDIASKGYDVSIYGTYNSIQEAYKTEKYLISKFGRLEYDNNGILCNRSVGGIDYGFKKIRNIPILQIDINTNQVIKEWSQPNQIENTLGYLRTNIVKCCRKKQLTAYGFKWAYKNGKFDHIDATAARKKNRTKGQILICENLVTNEIMEFRRQEDCAKHIGVSKSLIHSVLNEGRKHDTWTFRYKGWSLMR